jgi:methionyl-tRNA formyltransferase
MKDQCVDLVLVCGFQFILNRSMLGAFPYVINIHYSLLPDYRGPEPIIWGLLDRCRKFGITIHVMNGEIDSGNIISQASIEKPLLPLALEVENKLAKALPGLLQDTIQQVKNGSVSSAPQKGGFYLSVPTLKNRKKRACAVRAKHP